MTTCLLTKDSVPTLLSPDVQEILCAAIRKGLYVEDACALANISKGSYYQWLKAADEGNPICINLLNALKKAEAEHKEEKLSQIAAAGQKPHNWMAAAWQLERRYQNQYGQKQQLEATGEIVFRVLRDAPRLIEDEPGQVTEAEYRELLPEPEIPDISTA